MESCNTYAEGTNILHELNAGAKYVKEGDAEVAPMENPEDYQYDIDCAEVGELWRRGSVVGSWLLDLTADVLRGDRELSKFGGGVSDSGEGRWTVHAVVILVFPHLLYLPHYLNDLSPDDWEHLQNKVLNGMRQCLEDIMLGNFLMWISIPFVLTTVYFGMRKGENNYYETDKYNGNGTAH